jgi:glucose uptake protein GlcU
MEKRSYTGLEFVEGFSLLAGALWVIGALFFGAMVMIGVNRAGPVGAASNETPVAVSPETE